MNENTAAMYVFLETLSNLPLQANRSLSMLRTGPLSDMMCHCLFISFAQQKAVTLTRK